MEELDNINEIKITREELYEMVWSEPLSSIAKKYYISENGLQKQCAKLKIPLPSIRYWISLKAGNQPQDKMPFGEFSGYSTTYLKLREEVEGVKESIQKHLSRLKNEIENDPKVNLKVPDKLMNPDTIIALARDKLYKEKIWNKNQGIISGNSGYLEIEVSPNNFSRALRFMDTMIKGFKNRGHELITKNECINVRVLGEDFHIACREKAKRVTVMGRYGEETKYEPTGILTFRLGESYHLKEWSDGKIPIEEQVSKILAGIEYCGWKEREERRRREKIWAENKEKERIAKELQERKAKELADFKELFKKSKRHEEAEVIRRYIHKLEDSAISRNVLTEELIEKIEWARKKADWYDPFIEMYDELLNDVDREELKFKNQGFWY